MAENKLTPEIINLELNQTLIKPRFCEIDSLKITHHSKYIPWLEEASFNFVERVIGISRQELMDMDIYNPISSLNCEYKKGVRWSDQVLISIHMYYSKIAYFTMKSTLTSYIDPNVCFALANVKHIYTDKNLNLKLSTPSSFYDRIGIAAKKYPNYFTEI